MPQNRHARNVLLVVLTGLLATNLYPLFWMLAASLKSGGRGAWSFSNYEAILASGPFGRYALNSLLTTGAIVAGNTVFSLMAGYAFARKRFPFKNILFVMFLGSIMVPKQALMVPLFLMMSKWGLLDTYFALIAPFLLDGFNVFLMKQYIEGLPEELEYAARIDGASEFAILWRVVAPLSRPALAVAAINTSLLNWNSVLFPLILTTKTEFRTLPVGLALEVFGPHGADWGVLMAGSAVSTLPLLGLFLVFQRHIINGITAGALKG